MIHAFDDGRSISHVQFQALDNLRCFVRVGCVIHGQYLHFVKARLTKRRFVIVKAMELVCRAHGSWGAVGILEVIVWDGLKVHCEVCDASVPPVLLPHVVNGCGLFDLLDKSLEADRVTEHVL